MYQDIVSEHAYGIRMCRCCQITLYFIKWNDYFPWYMKDITSKLDCSNEFGPSEKVLEGLPEVRTGGKGSKTRQKGQHNQTTSKKMPWRGVREKPEVNTWVLGCSFYSLQRDVFVRTKLKAVLLPSFQFSLLFFSSFLL